LNIFSKYLDEKELQIHIKQNKNQKVLYEELTNMHADFAKHMRTIAKETSFDKSFSLMSMALYLDTLKLKISLINLKSGEKVINALLKAKEMFPAMKKIVENSQTAKEAKDAIDNWGKLYEEIFDIKKEEKLYKCS
jgi:hypothetical protein